MGQARAGLMGSRPRAAGCSGPFGRSRGCVSTLLPLRLRLRWCLGPGRRAMPKIICAETTGWFTAGQSCKKPKNLDIVRRAMGLSTSRHLPCALVPSAARNGPSAEEASCGDPYRGKDPCGEHELAVLWARGEPNGPGHQGRRPPVLGPERGQDRRFRGTLRKLFGKIVGVYVTVLLAEAFL